MNQSTGASARRTSDIFELSDRYIVDSCVLDPMLATFLGVPGYDDQMTDYSPDGWAARREMLHRTRCDLARIVPRNRRERIARDVMQERLDVESDLIESGEYHRWLSVLNSHHEYIREVFDFMPRESEEDWANVRTRLAGVPGTLDGLRESFLHAARDGKVAALRQVLVCAGQCTTWGQPDGPFAELAAECSMFDLTNEAASAAQAYLDFAAWLRHDYSRIADPNDPVGPERYRLFVRYQNGADLDLAEAYAWGWEELHNIERRMAELVERIAPGASRGECIQRLNVDPRYVVDTGDRFVAWNQEVIDRTIAELHGRYFDMAEPLRRCQVLPIPAGGPHTTYYTLPSEDFNRPGQTWVPVEGRSLFTLWDALSIAHHEGAPGHHLQLAQMLYLAESLTRFQRMGVMISGHGEGWAMYAERLMVELGYLDDPVYEFGFLVGQGLRAARVIVDIGLHCEMRIPSNERFHPGERWRTDLALPFMLEHTGCTAEYLSSEVDRYLGMPGQAISYKLGERIWLAGRERARLRLGPAFDLKHFHQTMLDMGAMGLDMLQVELDRYGSAES